DAARELRADVNGRGEDLARRLDALKKQVADRAPPAEVARGARGIRDEIVQRFNVILLPQRAPDPGRGARLYAHACAACHGVDGHPNLALELPTKPPDFRTEAGPLTPQRIFSAATYGVPKTAMPAFDSALTDEERWDVAFYVLSLAHPAASPRGLELARAALLPSRYADLATMSDDDLRARLAGLLEKADARGPGGGLVAFVAALAIALREGVEAALLVAAMLALLRKAGREGDARAVHVGWISALLAGALTWWASGMLLLHLSGASRELAEGVLQLVTAALLLYASHWLLASLSARRLVSFLSAKTMAAG